MKIITVILMCIIIFGCHFSNKSDLKMTNYTLKVQSNKNLNDKKKWIRLYVDNVVFDSVYLSVYKSSSLWSNNVSKYKFFNYYFDGVYHNFLGLLDTVEKKWILKLTSDNLGFVNPSFNGVTSNDKYFLFGFGDIGGERGIDIYNSNGKKVFSQTVLTDYGNCCSWTKNDEFEYWAISNIDTLPKLDTQKQEAWIQKFIWKDCKTIITDSIKKGFIP